MGFWETGMEWLGAMPSRGNLGWVVYTDHRNTKLLFRGGEGGDHKRRGLRRSGTVSVKKVNSSNIHSIAGCGWRMLPEQVGLAWTCEGLLLTGVHHPVHATFS